MLEAAASVVADCGYEAFSVEEVARRSGVNKTTIYRRWPTKADLIAESVRERSERLVPRTQSESLAGDLRQLTRLVAANIGSDVGGRMTKSLIAATTSSLALGELGSAFWSERLAEAEEIFVRAIERGDVPADIDGSLVIQVLIGPLYVRLLLTNEPIDQAFADRVAEFVLAAVRTKPPRKAKPVPAARLSPR